MPPIKIVMLGSGGVGKSAISIRFIHNNFVTDYDPTIENSYRKHLTLDSQEVMLDVLDTAGQEEYAAMRDSQIRSGMGFVLVYSITSRESFKDIRAFRDRILHVKDKDNFPCVMVGNKSDLQKDRAIETAEAMQLATELGIPFKECSAKTSSNISETFEDCTRLILRAIDQGLYEEESGGSFIPAVKRKKGGCSLL